MHIVMTILHIVALLVFWPALFITIPMHFLLSSQKEKESLSPPTQAHDPIFINCPSCKARVRATEEKCGLCGADLPIKESPPIPVSKLIKCPDCEKEISRLAKACPHCGHPFE